MERSFVKSVKNCAVDLFKSQKIKMRINKEIQVHEFFIISVRIYVSAKSEILYVLSGLFHKYQFEGNQGSQGFSTLNGESSNLTRSVLDY